MMKALLIRTQTDMDMGDIVKVAEAEGSNLFKKPNKVKVVDIVWSRYGAVAVVQRLDGSSQKSQIVK